MQKLTRFLLFLFLILAFGFILTARVMKPSVLILHSYNEKNARTVAINKGLNEILGTKNYINLNWYYMDIKHPHDPNLLYKAYQAIQAVISEVHPNVIIAFDQDAQAFLSQYYLNDPKIKLVFAGVGQPSQQELISSSNLVGVIEAPPFQTAHEILLTLFSKYQRIFYLSDNSIMSKSYIAEFKLIDWRPFKLNQAITTNTFREWQAAVLSANKTSDMLLIGLYQHISDDQSTLVPTTEIIRWTLQHSKIPIVGLFADFVREGGGFAIGVDEEELGHVTATLALEIIDHKKLLNKAQIRSTLFFVPYIRQSVFSKQFLDVTIPSLYLYYSKQMNAYFN